MALVIFIDALPYTYIANSKWAEEMQVSKLKPNIGYSSNLHWQLFANIYPDELGFFTDWAYEEEENKYINNLSNMLNNLDKYEYISTIIKKILDRYIFKTNAFANIPFKFRSKFKNKAQYLFFKTEYVKEIKHFENYELILQDENNKTYDEILKIFEEKVNDNQKNIFISLNFADSLGHSYSRSEEYNREMEKHIEKLVPIIRQYNKKNVDKKIMIVSDHGMSNVIKYVDLNLESKIGKQSDTTYISYCDSAIMRIYIYDENKKKQIEEYLTKIPYGHVISNEERIYYGITDLKFGDIIFNLHDGYMFKENWFGKSLKRKVKPLGMHGFWPGTLDQMAVLMMYNPTEKLKEFYDYRDAYQIIYKTMIEE